MTSVVLVDDEDLVRAGLRTILELAGLDVVGEAADGRDALVVVARTNPDVVLMDLRMPVMDGVECTRRLVASASSARVLALTTFDLDELVYAAMRRCVGVPPQGRAPRADRRGHPAGGSR